MACLIDSCLSDRFCLDVPRAQLVYTPHSHTQKHTLPCPCASKMPGTIFSVLHFITLQIHTLSSADFTPAVTHPALASYCAALSVLCGAPSLTDVHPAVLLSQSQKTKPVASHGVMLRW